MWFRNLQLFRLPENWSPDPAEWEARLARRPLQPCGGLERSSQGWLPPQGEGAYVYGLGGQLLVALGTEQRLLPSTVVRQAAQERVEAIEAESGQRLGRKRVREIREAVEDELLPRAFVRRTMTHAWIDPVHGWLAVDAASAARAETLVKLLGECLPDLPVRLLRTELSPGSAMTAWLAEGEGPAGFSIDRDCELRLAGEERATVRYVRHALDGEEVRGHIAAGKQATRLALTWAERISFVLNDRLELKRLAFLDLLKEEAGQAEDAEAAFGIEFALMSGELARLLADLVAALGGEQTA